MWRECEERDWEDAPGGGGVSLLVTVMCNFRFVLCEVIGSLLQILTILFLVTSFIIRFARYTSLQTDSPSTASARSAIASADHG